MDVLELPRPVINFLRTMAKEGCRYVLSWDIFGGTDAVTLTLTWKLNDNQSQLSKSPQQQVYNDLHIRRKDSLSSPPHRSRRDENSSTSAILRSSRGKSLEDNNLTPNKQINCHQPQVSSLERSSIVNRQNRESDPVYANLYNVRYATNSSPSSPLKNHPPLSVVSTHHRQAKQQCETPIIRKIIPSTPIVNNTTAKLRRTNHIATQNDEVDGTLDPWVKRFECSLEDTIQKFEDYIDKTGTTSGKVKFKRKPDYF